MAKTKNEPQFLLPVDAKDVFGKDKGSFSKWVKDGKVVAQDMQLYIKSGSRYYPLGTKTAKVVDVEASKKLLEEVKK